MKFGRTLFGVAGDCFVAAAVPRTTCFFRRFKRSTRCISDRLSRPFSRTLSLQIKEGGQDRPLPSCMFWKVRMVGEGLEKSRLEGGDMGERDRGGRWF